MARLPKNDGEALTMANFASSGEPFLAVHSCQRESKQVLALALEASALVLTGEIPGSLLRSRCGQGSGCICLGDL